LFSLLKPLGLTADQYNQYRQDVIDQVTASAGTFASNAIPVVTGIASGLIDFVLVFILSVYLVIDGPRAVNWLRIAAPASQRGRVLFYLDILSSKVGGYIRGQLIMSSFIGVMVGGGMAAFQVPFALLLGVLAFFMEFVPILGTIISGAACVLIALATKPPIIAVFVLVYFIVIHILEADIVGPRIVGRAVGLHPVVAILALTVGTELFGLWGAVFSIPIAGVLQALIISIWAQWRDTHPDQFTPARPKNLQPQPITAPKDQQPQEPVSSTPTTTAT
jgi:predicted PurR-regulated permease PerM